MTRLPIIAAAWFVLAAPPAGGEKPAPVDPFMGEYVGTYRAGEGRPVTATAQVVPGKGGTYKVVLLAEPPAKEGRKPRPLRIELAGKAEGERLTFSGQAGEARWAGAISGKVLKAQAEGTAAGARVEAKFAVRTSPTEGLKPPEGAVVLLPMTDKPPALAEWANRKWKPLPGGVMEIGKGDNTTVRSFGDGRLHLEFLIPHEPGTRGQGSGNSGVYIQGRYEVQILNSFGTRPLVNGCASLYRVAAPKLNASLPPLRWQTFDITFRRPRTDADGKLTRPGRITVVHNGEKVLDDVEFRSPTGAARGRGFVDRAPLRLQDHGHKVRFRNIWLVDLEKTAEAK